MARRSRRRGVKSDESASWCLEALSDGEEEIDDKGRKKRKTTLSKQSPSSRYLPPR